MTTKSFDEWFKALTGNPPFPYQRRLALDAKWPARIEIPTGLGKTLAVVCSWLWRRRESSAVRGSTPRRLVYCLPMRVLVEQTRDVIGEVLRRAGMPTRVVVLMGGVEDSGGWDTQPEDDAIIIGTQDMLLSRALNRGYGMSRYRWPLHFGLLNNDCLWVVDEVQLVGSGVATTTQLQALRRKLGTVLPVQTSWMSATLDQSWLRTVDVADEDISGRLGLEDDDRENPVARVRLNASKKLIEAKTKIGDASGLADEIASAHRPATRTLVIVNTVDRAREVFQQLKTRTAATRVLLHSRFRQADRDLALAQALAAPTEQGTIVVSTQVVEAGVDMTSATMFTEVAPWASLVQRFGRCNRAGQDPDATVFWVGLPDDTSARAKADKPYDIGELEKSEEVLRTLTSVGLAHLPKRPLQLETGLVLRKRDLVDLFDTTPDLTGNDVDVSRFIRDAEDRDVRVCWREFEEEPGASASSAARNELCSVPIGVIRDWAKGKKAKPMWTWNGFRNGRWEPASVERVHPGMVLLLRASDGGYDTVLGLDPKGARPVPSVGIEPVPTHLDHDDAHDGDPESEWDHWYTLKQHSDDVAAEARAIGGALEIAMELRSTLEQAGRWHDAGKAHAVWQAAARRLGVDPPSEPVAKSQAQHERIRYERAGFRHELASALMALQRGEPDLVCYLIACHHGKVRLSLRSMPYEDAPVSDGVEDPTIRYARGIWEGDVVASVDLGNGLVVPETRLTLSYMELGDDDETGPSWMSRMLALRDDPDLGPFRVGFLEGLIKAADERASRKARGNRGGT